MRTYLAVIAAILALAACSGTTTVHPAARTVPAATPAPALAACPLVMRAVADVASKAGIDLGSGSMHATQLTRQRESAWGLELGHVNVTPPNPTVADIRLQEDVLAADFASLISTNADAVKFVAALQKVQADCGR